MRSRKKSSKPAVTRLRAAPAAAPLELSTPGDGPRPAATSYDVARLARVSQSAVSRCFRPGASLSDDKRARILAATRQLGYAPDALARGLSTRRSNLVGVIISNLTNLHYPEVLSELNARCAERNVRVLLFSIAGENDVERVLAHVWQYRLDGVIAAAQLSDLQVRGFQRRQVALVFYNRYLHGRAVNAVGCDQIESARLIVDALVAAGHERFGLIGGPADSVVGAERIHSCINRLRHHRIKSFAIETGDYTYDGGRAAFSRFLRKSNRPPDAVIAVNDVMALGCLDAVRLDHGLRVPEDVSVVGFDGVEPASWRGYQLATIRQPVSEMAAAAVSLLLDCVDDPARRTEKRVFTGVMIERASARLRIQTR